MPAVTTADSAEAERAATVLKVTSKLLNLGASIDKLLELREQRRKLEAEANKLKDEYDIVEEHLMAQMGKQNMEKASSKLASVSVSSTVVGNVTDWEALNKFIKRTGHFHLYQRRLSDPAVRELFESKGSIPGVEPFTKKRLSLRTL